MTDKIIILGAGGMLGTSLRKAFKHSGMHAFNKSQVDITDKKSVFEKISQIKPHIVVNLAAYTNVDACESNQKLAFDVNGEGVKNIAEACKKNNSSMLHISTDYVFDGKKESYNEDDKTNPINIYGKSKELGEKYLIGTLNNYYLIRASWMFGKNGKNFVDAIVQLAKEKKELRVVDDQHGRPTYTDDLSKQIKNIIEAKNPFGIYHITNSNTCTWFEFAAKIVEIAGIDCAVKPMTSAELDRPAKRPKYSVLANNKLPPLRGWQSALKEYMEIKWKA